MLHRKDRYELGSFLALPKHRRERSNHRHAKHPHANRLRAKHLRAQTLHANHLFGAKKPLRLLAFMAKETD